MCANVSNLKFKKYLYLVTVNLYTDNNTISIIPRDSLSLSSSVYWSFSMTSVLINLMNERTLSWKCQSPSLGILQVEAGTTRLSRARRLWHLPDNEKGSEPYLQAIQISNAFPPPHWSSVFCGRSGGPNVRSECCIQIVAGSLATWQA